MVKWTRKTSMNHLAMGFCSCWIYLVHWNLGGSDGESFVLRPTSRGLNDPAGILQSNNQFFFPLLIILFKITVDTAVIVNE